MGKEVNYTRLFDEFAPVTTEQWEEVINKDLKGADYEKKLVWQTNEGFKVKPYYRQEDLKNLSYLETIPGQFPYNRGVNSGNNDWRIRQDIRVRDPKQANKKAREICTKGVDSIGFVFDEDIHIDDQFIHNLLADLPLENIEINFNAGQNSKEIIEILVEDNSRIEGSVNFNPLTKLTLTGNFCKSQEHSMDKAKDVVVASRELENFRCLTINGECIHNSGSTIVQELAFSLSMGAEYMTQLSDLGLEANEIASRIKFNLAVGSNYFMEIAKLRAARYLWAKICEANDVNIANSAMIIHSTTSRWNKTIYDPYVNMLRTTTEAMSAIIGGTGSLTIDAFNYSFEEPTIFGDRIARNQQILLKEESYLGKIADPSAGSYYIENLTNSVIEETWNLFLEIEKEGGYIEAFKKGIIQSYVNESARKLDQKIAQRREILLGTNQYPNFNENIDTDLDASVLNPLDKEADEKLADTLKPYRGAQAFERLRYNTDLFAKTNERPKAFMITMGNLAMRRARAQFASNFFACAGIEVIDNNGFTTVEDAAAAFRSSKSQIAVICSSDDEYAELAPALYNSLKDEAIFVVAGAPACIDDLKGEGIENYIHVKVNVLEELERYQSELGI